MTSQAWIYSNSPPSLSASAEAISLPSSIVNVPIVWPNKENKSELTISVELPESSSSAHQREHSEDDEESLHDIDDASILQAGDVVSIRSLDIEEAIAIQKSVSGWRPIMASCFGKKGRVIGIEKRPATFGQVDTFGVRVNVENLKFLWSVHLLRKVVSRPTFALKVGQSVRYKRKVEEKEEEIEGENVHPSFCGSLGKVEEVDEVDGSYRVLFYLMGKPHTSTWFTDPSIFEIVSTEMEKEKEKEADESEEAH